MAVAGTLHRLLIEFTFEEGSLASTSYSDMKLELERVEKASKKLEEALDALSPGTRQVIFALISPPGRVFPDSVLQKAYGSGREHEFGSDSDIVPKERWSKLQWHGRSRHVTLMKGAVQYAREQLERFNTGRRPLESAAESLARKLGAVFDEVKSDEFPEASWEKLCADVNSDSDVSLSAELARARAQFVSDILAHFAENGVLGAYPLHKRQVLSTGRVAELLGKTFKPLR